MDETKTLKHYSAFTQMESCGAWDILRSEILDWDKSLRDKMYHEMAHNPDKITNRTNLRNAGKLCAYEEVIEFVERALKDGKILMEKKAKRDNQ